VRLLDAEPGPGRAPSLVIGIGNPARGDDAIGPLLLDGLRAELARRGADVGTGIELLDAFQLQPEHALDLRGRRCVILVDAAVSGPAPFVYNAVVPDTSRAVTTHRLSPAALAAVYAQLYGSVPPLKLLAVRGERFELGAALSDPARSNLDAALRWLGRQLGVFRDARPPAARDCGPRSAKQRAASVMVGPMS
jgi:hydrogenase maturation protease